MVHVFNSLVYHFELTHEARTHRVRAASISMTYGTKKMCIEIYRKLVHVGLIQVYPQSATIVLLVKMVNRRSIT